VSLVGAAALLATRPVALATPACVAVLISGTELDTLAALDQR